ncbi:MAG: hypothetical protein ACT4NX_05145 [Deltaproteobacteria bacterium]
MPVYEYECDSCVEEYNADIDGLVAKVSKAAASKLMKKNPKFYYIEVFDDSERKAVFALGEKGKPNIRKFRFKLEREPGKFLYIELKNFKFSELVYNKEEEKDLKCPACGKGDRVRRVFSTFRAIFDDKNKRAPRPGDDLKYHMDYKVMKDEEIKSDWVGQDHLNQYFNR